jgi:inner membrane transporter RhtA
LLWGLMIAAISSAIPISLEMVALKRLPASAFGIMTSLEPAVAALLGWIVLHEHLTFGQWLAIVCVMSAAIGSSLFSRPPRRDSEASQVVT